MPSDAVIETKDGKTFTSGQTVPATYASNATYKQADLAQQFRIKIPISSVTSATTISATVRVAMTFVTPIAYQTSGSSYQKIFSAGTTGSDAAQRTATMTLYSYTPDVLIQKVDAQTGNNVEPGQTTKLGDSVSSGAFSYRIRFRTKNSDWTAWQSSGSNSYGLTSVSAGTTLGYAYASWADYAAGEEYLEWQIQETSAPQYYTSFGTNTYRMNLPSASNANVIVNGTGYSVRSSNQEGYTTTNYPGDNGVFNGQRAAAMKNNEKVRFKFKKASDAPAYTDYNWSYAFSDIKYNLYSDAACTNLLWTLNSESEVTDYYNAGTYYMKEASSNPYYQLSDKVYTVSASAGNIVTVNVSDPPTTWNGNLLTKVDGEDYETDGTMTGVPNAEYTVKIYYHYGTSRGDETDAGKIYIDEQIAAAGNTWHANLVNEVVLKTDANGVLKYDNDHLVSGTLLTGSDGNPAIPLCYRVSVEETKSPDGYELDPNVYFYYLGLNADKSSSMLSYVQTARYDDDGKLQTVSNADRENAVVTSSGTSDAQVTVLENPLTTYTVVKNWKDNENKYNLRPTSINITFSGKVDDEVVYSPKTVTLSEDNDWTADFSALPVYKTGTTTEIEYSVEEAIGETAEVIGTAGSLYPYTLTEVKTQQDDVTTSTKTTGTATSSIVASGKKPVTYTLTNSKRTIADQNWDTKIGEFVETDDGKYQVTDKVTFDYLPKPNEYGVEEKFQVVGVLVDRDAMVKKFGRYLDDTDSYPTSISTYNGLKSLIASWQSADLEAYVAEYSPVGENQEGQTWDMTFSMAPDDLNGTTYVCLQYIFLNGIQYTGEDEAENSISALDNLFDENETVEVSIGSITVKKQNGSGQNMTGVTFRLETEDGEEVETKTTGTDGTVVFENLEKGTYVLKETKTLAGYELLPEPITISIPTDGEYDVTYTIKNNEVIMPLTGSGNFVWIGVVIGIFLILLGGYGIISHSKKKRKQNA